MFKKIILGITFGFVSCTGVMAKAPTATKPIEVLVVENKEGKITPKTIEAVFEKAGFFINDNRDMLAPFKKNFGKTHHEVYNLFTIFKKDHVLKLAKKYPNIGLFTPMSMSIYTPKGEKKLYVSRLSAEAMAHIMGIPADDADLVAYADEVSKVLHDALGKNATAHDTGHTPAKAEGALVYTKSIKMPKDADAEEFKDEFQMKFEGMLPPAEFIMAGFNDLNYDFTEAKYEGYTFYDVYSICNLEVIYTVSQKYPEAGAFAPCSLYMYNKEGEDTVEIGFPTVYNWFAVMGISDEASRKVLLKAQYRMEDLLSKLAGDKKEESKQSTMKCAPGKCGGGKCGGAKSTIAH